MSSAITYTINPVTVEVRVSKAPVVHVLSGDVIADVNQRGNWIRGLELLGSGLQFSLERALSSIEHVRSGSSVQEPQQYEKN